MHCSISRALHPAASSPPPLLLLSFSFHTLAGKHVRQSARRPNGRKGKPSSGLIEPTLCRTPFFPPQLSLSFFAPDDLPSLDLVFFIRWALRIMEADGSRCSSPSTEEEISRRHQHCAHTCSTYHHALSQQHFGTNVIYTNALKNTVKRKDECGSMHLWMQEPSMGTCGSGKRREERRATLSKFIPSYDSK